MADKRIHVARADLIDLDADFVDFAELDASLQVEADAAKEGLQRLYVLVEDGLAEMDDLLHERISILKADREKAQAALGRRAPGGPVASLPWTQKRSRPFQNSCGTCWTILTIPRARHTFARCSTWMSVPKRSGSRAAAKRSTPQPTPLTLRRSSSVFLSAQI